MTFGVRDVTSWMLFLVARNALVLCCLVSENLLHFKSLRLSLGGTSP